LTWPYNTSAPCLTTKACVKRYKQRAVYEAFPRSKCALAFKAIAQKVDTWPLPANPRGHLEFFVERLVHQTAGPVL